jgi:phosphoglycolate phosphatase
MNVKNIKVVAFDCDGVMFDTTRSNKAYYNQLLDRFDQPALTDEQFRFVHMHTVDGSLDYLFPDKNMRRKVEAVRKEMNYSSLIQYMEIEPHLKPLINKLRPEYNTAVVTNRSDTMNGVLFEHDLEGYFDIVISALDVTNPKPHPEGLLKILSHFNLKSHEAVYIGDSELDETAARESGIPLIAYNNPSLSAWFHIQSLKEVEDILEIDDKG